MPHSPHTPPARLLDKYRDKAPSLEVAKYWAMIEWFDETCGQLLDHLDGKGLARDTMVLYLADNGWIQDPAADRYAPRSKQSPYDGGLRTPIIVRWPGKVRPRASDQPVLSLDLAPTILAAAGVSAPAEMPGVNLLDEPAVELRNAIFVSLRQGCLIDSRRSGRVAILVLEDRDARKRRARATTGLGAGPKPVPSVAGRAEVG
jgi:arylsulfatase A-like enzyme